MRWIIQDVDSIEPALRNSRTWGSVVLEMLGRERWEADHMGRMIRRRVERNNGVFERDLAVVGAWRRVASECMRREERKGGMRRCWERCKISCRRMLGRDERGVGEFGI